MSDGLTVTQKNDVRELIKEQIEQLMLTEVQDDVIKQVDEYMNFGMAHQLEERLLEQVEGVFEEQLIDKVVYRLNDIIEERVYDIVTRIVDEQITGKLELVHESITDLANEIDDVRDG